MNFSFQNELIFIIFVPFQDMHLSSFFFSFFGLSSFAAFCCFFFGGMELMILVLYISSVSFKPVGAKIIRLRLSQSAILSVFLSYPVFFFSVYFLTIKVTSRPLSPSLMLLYWGALIFYFIFPISFILVLFIIFFVRVLQL